jgi:hypothetical protein
MIPLEQGTLMVFHTPRLAALALIITSVSVLPFSAPRRDFKQEDFAKLRWIEGAWKGTGTGVKAFYECYHFVNDSTIELVTSSDPELRTISERSTFALRNGRISNEAGRSLWEASRIATGVVQFMPMHGASNAFQFNRISKDHWTATIVPLNSTAKHTVYEMKRK